MEFEQLTIDQQKFDQPPTVCYNQLDNSGFIYCKIDWFTAIFQDCSMNHVLKWLKLDGCVSDFLLDCYEQSRGYDNVFKFGYNGIMLETSSLAFYNVSMDVGIFDIVVPKIRLELSGSALDYLRTLGVNFETYRFNVPELPLGGCYHVTRCDFAYDFVNYKPEFIDLLIDHIITNKLPSERIPLASTKGAISCKVVSVGQKTIYLGSPQADKMLRCYDKRMQFVDLNTGCYKKANPYNDPESWFRIEWQTRNKTANALALDSTLDFKHILKMIFNHYAFAKGDHSFAHGGGSRPVVDFWLTLFPWQEIETRIIQNAKYVACESAKARTLRRFRSMHIRNFIFAQTVLGRDGVDKECNDYLDNLFMYDDPLTLRRRQAFLCELNALDLDLPVDKKLDSGLWFYKGRPHFTY